ncbi:MAG: FimB/Mfa2 family fimbrial subunit [Alistipes sp.]|jgi:hypothetical protein|nr:FimB/Mfa2 family fimbrial subunit [Alistipes sp.]
MKRHAALVVALVAASVQLSCVSENTDDCPPDIHASYSSLTLTFDLAAEPLNGIPYDPSIDFLEAVSSVDVYLFDWNLQFVTTRRIEQGDLQAFPGVVFDNLPAGEYHVICWANLSQYTRRPHVEVGTRIHELVVAIESRETGGPIFYAPNQPIETFTYDWGGDTPIGHPTDPTRAYTRAATRQIGGTRDHEENHEVYIAEVVVGEENTKLLEFLNVHRKVQVYIKGWENAPFYDGQPPVIENCHSSNVIDFYLDVDDTPASLVQEGVSTATPEGTMPGAEFYSALAPFHELSGICLFNHTDHDIAAGGTAGYTLEFDDWVAENDWENTGDIALMITFAPEDDMGNVNVSVTVPSWLRHEVEPEY